MEETEEEYWGSSKVKNSRQKLNMFDDNVTVEKASEIAKYRKGLAEEEEDDDDDAIGWADDPVAKPVPHNTISYVREPPFRPPATAPGSSVPRPTFEPSYNSQKPPASSFMTHNRSRSDVLVGSMGKMTLSNSPSLPDPGGARAGSQMSQADSEPSIASMVDTWKTPQTVGVQSTRQKDDEIQYLRRQLEYTSKTLGGSKLKVDDTIKRMIRGQPYSLELYKSKAEKIALLDKAIATHDGNTIIAVVVFLKRTLKDQLFNLELMRRPVAIDQYMAYLKAHYNIKEYEHMLQLLGRADDQAMMKYKQAVTVEDPLVKIDRLKHCLQAHFQHTAGMETDTGLIQQHIALLHRQRPVDVADDMAEKEGKHLVFRSKPRVASIIHMPVITTLYYCCIYHYEEPENLLASPAAIRKEHQLTEKQFIWTALRARAHLRKWQDIEALFITKGFFGGTKMKSVVGFEKVATILHKCDAQAEVVAKYLKLVDDVDKRLEVAHKLQCHDAIIETYAAQRDRRTLEQYLNRCKPNSREWFMARGVLNDQSIKWKS